MNLEKLKNSLMAKLNHNKILRPLTSRSMPKEINNKLRYGKTKPSLIYCEELMHRLLKAYRLSIKDASKAELPSAQLDMWNHIIEKEMRQFQVAIEAGDTKAMFNYLSNIGEEYVWFGGLTLGLDGYTPKEWSEAQVAELYWEKLVALGESCGALNIENPESGPYQLNIKIDPTELLEKLEKKLEISLEPPANIFSTFGIEIKSSVYHYRHINAIYAAQIIHSIGAEHANIIEIGGGLGLVAFYLRRMGYIKKYSIYDLPVSCLISGFYLVHALGKDKVCLYGEAVDDNAVSIRPYWTVEDVKTRSVDLVINQDGLNEIDLPTVEFIMENIERVTKSGFLSLNHETFGNDRCVSYYVHNFTKLQRFWRAKNWVREGYVDEFYRHIYR